MLFRTKQHVSCGPQGWEEVLLLSHTEAVAMRSPQSLFPEKPALGRQGTVFPKVRPQVALGVLPAGPSLSSFEERVSSLPNGLSPATTPPF